MLPFLDGLRDITFFNVLVRMLVAVFCSAAIGLERSVKNRSAGFRTHILVCVGAATASLTGHYLYLIAQLPTDMTRIGAQVITGLGFIGAGTIIVTGKQEVTGLTTAAGLWASACMGLAVGAGFIECVLVSFLLIVLCMRVLPAIETLILNRSRNMLLYVETENILQLSAIINYIKREEIRIFSLEINRDSPEPIEGVSAVLDIRLPIHLYHAEFVAALSTLNGVISIDEI